MLLFYWILLSWAVSNTNPKLAMAQRLSRQGLYQYAVEQLDKMMESDEYDSDVYSYRGHVLSLRGKYHHALVDFEYGLESDRMNGRDGEAFAYSRFVTGDCGGIEETRALRLFGEFHPAALVRLYATEIEMARYCNKESVAWDLHSEMAYDFPRAVKTHLALADLSLDIGDLDSAWRAMANSQMYFQYPGVLDLYARLALVEQRYEDAFQLLQYIKAQRVTDRSMILKGLASILANDPSVLMHKLNQPRWSDNDNPHVLFLRVWALNELGDTKEFNSELAYYQSQCNVQCQRKVVLNLEREIQAPLPFGFP